MDRRNRRVLTIMLLIVFGMGGLGFASVPLYRLFCQATGFNGTTQRADEAVAASTEVTGRIVSVRFDSNVSPRLPWTFRPEQVTERVAIGARKMAFFTARNDSDRPITGRAEFNVTPTQAGAYFVKVQCFCFNEQTLQPHQEVRMPVVYYVDPGFLKDADTADISEITLSYTFFPVDSGKAAG